MLNVELLKHPLNWLIIWLMLLIAALGGKYAIQFAGMLTSPSPTQSGIKGVTQ
jgi:hypothetical protein